MRPERHTMTPLSALDGVQVTVGDDVPVPGRPRPTPDEDHGVGARPERLGDAVRRLASSTSGLIAIGGLLVVAACWSRIVRRRLTPVRPATEAAR